MEKKSGGYEILDRWMDDGMHERKKTIKMEGGGRRGGGWRMYETKSNQEGKEGGREGWREELGKGKGREEGGGGGSVGLDRIVKQILMIH